MKLDYIIQILSKYATTKSTSTFKHSACIIKKNKILSIGYNYHLTKNIGNKYTVHAEVSSILNLPKQYRRDLQDCELIVIRIGGDGEIRCSKPCKNCMDFINKHKIKKIRYSM